MAPPLESIMAEASIPMNSRRKIQATIFEMTPFRSDAMKTESEKRENRTMASIKKPPSGLFASLLLKKPSPRILIFHTQVLKIFLRKHGSGRANASRRKACYDLVYCLSIVLK
jgi:hypothetical protein